LKGWYFLKYKEDLVLWFQLKKLRGINVFGVNIVDFFNTFFDNAYVLSKSSLTDSYNDSIIFQMDEV